MSAAVINPLPSRGRKWATRFLFVVLLFIALFAVYRCILRRVVAAKLEAIRSAGYPVTLTELDKWYPQVSVSGNGAELFGAAFAKLTDGTNPSALPRTDLAYSSRQPEPLSVAAKQAVVGYLASNAEAIALLNEAASVKHSRYPLNLSRLSISPYPHLQNLHRSAYLLEMTAIGSADDQNPEVAVRSVNSLLGAARSLAAEPLVRSHLARIDCQRIAVMSLERVLNKTIPTDSQLAELSAALKDADNPLCLTRAFAGQRCTGVYGFEMMAVTMNLPRLTGRRPDLWAQRLAADIVLLFSSPAYLYQMSGLLQWDELRYLQFMDQYVNTADAPFPERIADARALQRAVEGLPRLHVLTGQWLRAMGGARIVLRDAIGIARLRIARVAVTVERYRLAQGRLPETLAELTPVYLAALPIDPFSGQCVRYEKLAKGYVIYSVGEDGGGDEKKNVTFAVER